MSFPLSQGFFECAFPGPTSDWAVGFAFVGTDGLQAHASGLGIAMGHDTKSVRCDPPTEVPARAVGAPELLRGRTVAQKIVLVALSNFAERVVGRR